LGDLVEGFASHEDRSKGLVVSLEGLVGFEEELAGVIPIHDAGSRMLIIFLPETSAKRTPKIGVEKGSTTPSSRRSAVKTGGKHPESISTGMALKV
jgi:hypothetical protein